MLFNHNKVQVHTCVFTMVKIHKFSFELLPHPSYVPDLVPWDNLLFPNSIKWLYGKRFRSKEEVIIKTNAYFKDSDKSLKGIKKYINFKRNLLSLKETVLRNKTFLLRGKNYSVQKVTKFSNCPRMYKSSKVNFQN